MLNNINEGKRMTGTGSLRAPVGVIFLDFIEFICFFQILGNYCKLKYVNPPYLPRIPSYSVASRGSPASPGRDSSPWPSKWFEVLYREIQERRSSWDLLSALKPDFRDRVCFQRQWHPPDRPDHTRSRSFRPERRCHRSRERRLFVLSALGIFICKSKRFLLQFLLDKFYI